MKLSWLVCAAMLAAGAVPAAVTTTASAALGAQLPRIAAAGARPAAPASGTVRPGGNVAGGAELWRARYGKPRNSVGYPDSAAVSPDGSQLYIAGTRAVDYDTATGAQRWAAPTGLSRGAFLGVSPDGSRVFVTGHTTAGPPATGATAYATVAYDTATGAERWTRLYTGSVPGFTQATGVAVSPDSSRVFVTGGATGPNRQPEINYTTLAYSP